MFMLGSWSSNSYSCCDKGSKDDEEKEKEGVVGGVEVVIALCAGSTSVSDLLVVGEFFGSGFLPVPLLLPKRPRRRGLFIRVALPYPS